MVEVKLIVDDVTLDMINLSTIDYNEEMIRQSFEVHANPNADLGCSCGVSFSPKNAWAKLKFEKMWFLRMYNFVCEIEKSELPIECEDNDWYRH